MGDVVGQMFNHLAIFYYQDDVYQGVVDHWFRDVSGRLDDPLNFLEDANDLVWLLFFFAPEDTHFLLK